MSKVKQKEKEIVEVIGTLEIGGHNFNVYDNFVEPLFLATEVAKLLNERDGYTVARKVHESEKLSHKISVVGKHEQIREVTFLTEFGLYEVFMKSTKVEGVKWKTEVKQQLKQIRITGGYIPINSNDTEETINKKAQEIAQSTIKHKDKLLKQLEDDYKKLEFKYEIEQYKSQLYRTERDEAIQECKELEEDINTLKDIAIESLHLHTKIQGTLGLKDIIIKVTGSSHGWQTYRQWMKDKYDNGLLTDCGISYTRYKLCSKEFIINCDDIRALEVLQEMFNDFYNPSINGMTIEL